MTRLHVLGGGTPTPTPSRFGSAYVVEVAGEHLMFDCGPAATHKLVKAGLAPTQIDHVFFTHHHFDHDIDYPCFVLCRWDQSIGEENDLRVYGPTLTERITREIVGEDGMFSHDWKARVGHPLSQTVFVNRGGTLPRRPPTVRATDIEAGWSHASDNWLVRTGHAQHVQPFLDSVAYRLETPDGSIVFTGDTSPCPEVVDLAKAADVLVCMCWDSQGEMDANGEDLGQCGTTGAARMAAEAGVERLVLTHMGPRISQHGPLEEAIVNVSKVYDGRVEFVEELGLLEL
jgi:ribonuclease Z